MSAGRFHDDMTLGEAREVLRQLVDAGEKCPCCTQLAKVYRRSANARMTYGLIRLWREVGVGTFGHLASIAGDGCETGKLRYWGLVAEETARREDGGRSGWWLVTPEGESFIRGRLWIPKYARIYDGRCLGFAGEQISVRDALGKKFHYDELMAGI